MKTAAPDQNWFDDFIVELRLRNVYGRAIGDTVASARELTADTGQSAEEAFGPARDYAASLELPRDDQSLWRGASLWPAMAGLLAFLLFTQALAPWAKSEPLLVSPLQLVFQCVTVGFIALLPLYLTTAIRHPWLLGLVVVIGAAAGFFSSLVTPETADEAWLVLAAGPWLVGSVVALVLISVGNTIRTIRRGYVDDIIDPLQHPAPKRERSGLVLALLTDWLFPIAAALMFALVMLALGWM